jgi:putative ABC transport system permease protein
MIKNDLRIAWRNLRKHKFYTFINTFGLALSMACGILLFLFISYHLSFVTYHKKAKHLYRIVHHVTFEDGVPLYDQGAPLALARDLKISNTQVKDVGVLLRMHDVDVTIPANNGAHEKMFAEHENTAIADKHFFNLFDYQWEQGSQTQALTQPNTVVLSHSLAQKYFGSQDVMGKSISINNKIVFKVTGVITDHAANTDIKADMFLSLSSLKNIYPANKVNRALYI